MTSRMLSTILTVALSVAAMAAVLSQCRKPRWWPGWIFLGIMNMRHASVTRWGLGHVLIEPSFTILDVGCGGGKTIATLADLASSGRVFGVDYAATSVAVARRVNAAAIVSGRVDIQQASVSRLPFPDSTFDLISAIETHYYWPDPVNDLHEILRVLKPGGRLVVIAETYKGERFDRILAVPMKLLRARYLTAREHRELFAATGFVDITLDVERRRGWICGVARKPGAQGD